jgi:capsular polysaccharide biosynthesis protein
MKNLISQNRVLLICVLLFTMAGTIFSLTSTKMYVSKSHIALFRLKIETPDSNSEESRNRWVWIRDGLNLKSALITDEMLDNIIISNSTAKEKAEHYKNKQLMKEYLKSLINIQFTGADENNFLVEVKAPSPSLAFDLNTIIFDRIRYLAVEADESNFKSVLDELRKKQSELKLDPDTYGFYQDKIRKMVFTHTIDQKQRESAFLIISKPALNEQPIWPNHKMIIILSAFIGLVIGFSLEFILKFCQREK